MIIDKIESITTARSGGGISVSRRLLVAGIRIDISRKPPRLLQIETVVAEVVHKKMEVEPVSAIYCQSSLVLG